MNKELDRLESKLPIITVLNGRNFSKTTSLLDRPFSLKFIELLSATMLKLMAEVDGTLFGYVFSDKIIIVSRNDQTEYTDAWQAGNIQKIVSSCASIATAECNKFAHNNGIDLLGAAIFTAQVFTLQNMQDVIKFLMSKQQDAFHIAVSSACFHEMMKKYNIGYVKNAMATKTAREKIEILANEFNVDFYSYALPFYRGVAAYRAPKAFIIEGIHKLKMKIKLDAELPIFTREKEFLEGIFKI
jgi:tRNA(His) 5'-end guanylyltransferase